MPQYRLHYHITNKQTIAKTLYEIFTKFKKPPATILDLTHGRGNHTRLLRNSNLAGYKYTLVTMDIDPKYNVDIVGDLCTPEKYQQITKQKWDIIYCDPPYLEDMIIRNDKFKKNANTYKHNHSNLLQIIFSLNKYHAYQKSGGVFIIKIQDQSKNNQWIPHIITLYNTMRNYIPLQPIVYTYSISGLNKYGYFMPFIKP